MTKLKELPAGASYAAELLITSASIETTAKKTKYASLTLLSMDGEKISAKKWNTESLSGLEVDTVVSVLGEVNVYNNNKSIIIKKVSESEVSPEAFPEESPLSSKETKNLFKEFFDSITNPNLQEVVRFVVQHAEGYFKAPAAKSIHHTFKGGLAFHSLTMARSADAFCKIYPYLNRDLLISAAIIHDAGKTIELADGAYSTQGHLYGHIIIVNDLIQEAIFNNKELAADNEVALLKHIILAHHGKLEWGSPVLGATPEAIIFHHIDKIDADMMIATTALESTNAGEFTGRQWALDNRVLFNPDDTPIL